MNDALAWLNRSWPLLRWRGLTVRVSLLLLIVAVLFGASMARPLGWWALPAGAVIAVAAMVLHALAHVAAIRAVRGQVSETTASALVDLTPAFIPPRAWPTFACAAAGPAANAAVAAAAGLALPAAGHGLAAALLGLVIYANLGLALLNLLACAPFDGRLLWRGALWPLLGLRRAGLATIYLGYLSGALLVAWGLAGTDLLGVLMGAFCLVNTWRDHQVARQGGEPALDVAPRSDGGGLLARWQAARQAAGARRAAQEAAADQEVLDRLLAKVSAGGLPSLSADERATLQRISKRQQRRAR